MTRLYTCAIGVGVQGNFLNRYLKGVVLYYEGSAWGLEPYVAENFDNYSCEIPSYVGPILVVLIINNVLFLTNIN